MDMTSGISFPRDTTTEQALDGVLRAFAIVFAVGWTAWLFAAAPPTGGVRQVIGLTVYGVGLVGVFIASATYNSCCPGPAKVDLSAPV